MCARVCLFAFPEVTFSLEVFGTVIYIYHDQPLRLPWPSIATATATANHVIPLDRATILSWAHDLDCQHTIACDTIEEGSLNH